MFEPWTFVLIAIAGVSGGLLLWVLWQVIQVWDVDPWA